MSPLGFEVDLGLPNSTKTMCVCKRILKNADDVTCASCGRHWVKQHDRVFQEVLDGAER